MSSAEQRPDSTYFRPERTHVIATLLMTGIALIGISWAPLALGWLLIFPILFLVWVFKAHTHIDDRGVTINYLWRKNVTLPWEEFDGIAFKGSKALARDKQGREYSMPGVTFNSLPRLEEASDGRIPDVLTEGLASVDGKVTVIDKDGRQVLMSKEEHEAYEASKKSDFHEGHSPQSFDSQPTKE
ncbi:PH domain-containing protein [Corynebacterium cystitidis]|uniref:PH domain-containing protein n=1 Tax=Corynebacterium cystitidis DSM 20524 TaxID=1121357 RepID=A0A1H9S6V2_9CORY|nr:PH domain-containing protein [Corynebacterium cystitidis]WJY82224.1 Low molecular weight protein antigen 6 [Corynebacterium cystitidis DSM 20524]SER80355.1 PH domain-containing protein [Corynebacterium cystitidis DSM 20524]SNV77608.1 Low molecular weight protein antigen 6 [Corynebacterium cystitidis]